MDSNSIAQTISATINDLIQSLFASVDNNVYSYIDNIVFIDESILESSKFENLFGSSTRSGILLIANSLIIAFFIYYCIKLFLSYYSSKPVERPYQFIFKLLLICIIINSSYFICKEILFINNLISSSFCEIGEIFTKKQISFKTLVSELNTVISLQNSSIDIFSVDGILKSFCSIGLLNLMLSYSLRYILLNVFILLSPFAFLSLSVSFSSWFFRSWLRALFSLLFLQSFVSIILIVILALNFSDDILSKFIYIGAIYALIRGNSYIRQLIGGISTDINTNLSTMKSLIKMR